MSGVIFGPLPKTLSDKLMAWLDGRPEPYAAECWVSGWRLGPAQRPPGRRLSQVVVSQGPGSGAYDTLDSTSVRVNVYAGTDEDAEDLALLVRAFFEGPVRDGDPVVYSTVNSGPAPVTPDTGDAHWYMVVDVIRRGTNLN